MEDYNCCALCGMFSCDCGPGAPCRQQKPYVVPKPRADGKNAYHVPVEINVEKERTPATELEWLYAKVDQLSEDCDYYRKALTKIASYKEGKVVTGMFDEPYSALVAREALVKRKDRKPL